IASVAHEDAEIVARKGRAVYDVAIEGEVQRDAGGAVIVECQADEIAFFGFIARQSVELIAESRKLANGQVPVSSRGDQTAGSRAATRDVFDHEIGYVPNIHAVVVDQRAVLGRAPQLHLLMFAVTVNQEIREAKLRGCLCLPVRRA